MSSEEPGGGFRSIESFRGISEEGKDELEAVWVKLDNRLIRKPHKVRSS